MRTWFLIDLISSLPLDYIIAAVTHHDKSQLVGASRALRVLRFAKLLSLLRLLRVSRLVRYVSQYEVVSETCSKNNSYWTSGKNSLELIELSSINKVSLV